MRKVFVRLSVFRSGRVIRRVTKIELRREMRARVRALAPERPEKSRAICERIAEHPAFAAGRVIGVFAPLPGEPDVELLWEKGGRGFCYPRVVGEEIEFVAVPRLADLTAAAWNVHIREPVDALLEIVEAVKIDLLLVPGLAFTRAGLRLGRGGGFYDRFLAGLPAQTVKLGVCFDAQLIGDLPWEPHDQRVDAVVTESGVQMAG